MRKVAVGLPDSGWIAVFLLVALTAPAGAQVALEPTQIAEQAKAATVQILSLDEQGRRLGSGTGFVISDDGLVVTNFHVIRSAHSLRIDLSDGDERTEVFYLGGDPANDIAVLRVAAAGLPFLRLHDEPDPAVGQRIYTMGHPLGQTATFSDGLVSALRTVADVSLIQITAPISSGSSGGPVMNDEGAVIGIVTMMLRGGQNLNFAVPRGTCGPCWKRRRSRGRSAHRCCRAPNAGASPRWGDPRCPSSGVRHRRPGCRSPLTLGRSRCSGRSSGWKRRLPPKASPAAPTPWRWVLCGTGSRTKSRWSSTAGRLTR